MLWRPPRCKRCFCHAVLDGRLEADAALERLAGLAPFAPFVNGFYRGAEGATPIDAEPLASE